MKICIYSGEIPSTVFIERLIEGLAKKHTQIILVGYIKKQKEYPENIKVRGYTNKWSKLWLFLRLRLLFLFQRSEWKKLKSIRKKNENLNTLSKILNWYIKTMPIVWYKPDIFHLQWVKNINEWLFLKEFCIKIVVSLRGAHINYSPIASQKVKNKYIENFPNVNGFHGVSKSICSEAGKYGIPADYCKVIYSGLDLTYFTYHKKKQVPGNQYPIRILSVGRAHWKKGYIYALDACKLLQSNDIPFTYEIVGGKSEEILFQVHQLNLTEKVTITDTLPFNQIVEKIRQSDILLLSSVEEGIANVVLEAMALGTAVISTDCGGMSEIIKNGENGWLVPVRNPKAIFEKISEIRKQPIKNIIGITQKGRMDIEKNHNQEKMVNEMINFYKKIKYKETN
jgi:colanic acid/amylovoran biosynthesis glycosyltransferase